MRAKQVFEHYPRQDRTADGFTHCPFCGAQLRLDGRVQVLRPACPECGFVWYRNPAPTVSVLVVDGDRVLLGRRGGEPGKGTWSLPSGYIEYDDDFIGTAVREAKEETGLEVRVCSILNVVSSFVSPRYHFLGIYVTACMVGGKLEAGDDLEAVEWVSLQGPLPEMGFEEDLVAIELQREGQAGLPVEDLDRRSSVFKGADGR